MYTSNAIAIKKPMVSRIDKTTVALFTIFLALPYLPGTIDKLLEFTNSVMKNNYKLHFVVGKVEFSLEKDHYFSERNGNE